MTEPADHDREDLAALPLPVVVPPWRIDDAESRAVARFRSREAAERLYDAYVRSMQAAQGRRVPAVTVDDTQAIARAAVAPVGNVAVLWPLVVDALAVENIDRELVRAGAAATIAAETYAFSSESERGGPEYFVRYEGRSDLGNMTPGDGYRFRGRGPLQLTGRKNYQRYGDRLGLDLVHDPDRAIEPAIAAKIFAKYFALERVSIACEREDWLRVRRRVNGGYGNWAKFARVLRALLPQTVIPSPPGLVA